jgi:hypothetical protein
MERCSDEISALQGLCVIHFREPVCCEKHEGSTGVTLRINECNHAFVLLPDYIGSLRQAQQIERLKYPGGHPLAIYFRII